ncbi:MAG: hypothetical protein AB1898_00040 [Acidobacteriota bacterium]
MQALQFKLITGTLVFFFTLWTGLVPAQHRKLSPLRKAAPVTMAALGTMRSQGVSVVEVSDYVFGNYRGEFPSPPHADGNAKKAFVVFWKEFPFRFVFAHEGSYCPWFEFRSGAGFCYQFFEGNEGWAELFNDWGRKERNSFVDVLETGPQRVWIRWTYFGVNMEAGEPAYRGTEDFWAYPNGLVLRRQTYESLLPDKNIGYAREPIEMIGMCPVGKLWTDVLKKSGGSSDYHALAVLDPFSKSRYDVFWKPTLQSDEIWKAEPRRTGADWKLFDDSAGVALIVPMQEGSPFCIFGDASGFGSAFTRIKEHSFRDTGGWGWISKSWDHWPIGWLNSQAHAVDAESLKKYPNHFSPAGMDFWELPNEESAQREFYSLIGVGGNDLEAIRAVAKRWLEQGESAVTNPDNIRDFPAVSGK